MQYTSLIDNITSKKWGLSLTEAYVFSYIANCVTWTDPLPVGGDIYYFLSKTVVTKELALISDKIDTIYRIYRSLQSKGIITIKKIDGKDYVKFEKKAASWNKFSDSEINPNELGNKSENDSEINPTYQCTILDQCTSIISKTIGLLNEKSKSDFHPETKSTVSLIKARLKEKYTEDDLLIVVNFKCTQWLNDPKMAPFLRPKTLFGDKFEGYLNEAKRAAAKPKTGLELKEETLAAIAATSEFNQK